MTRTHSTGIVPGIRIKRVNELQNVSNICYEHLAYELEQ